ncbi:phosphoribosylanthranilate isomerase [bacterium]|nr:phosphoribosylanthranilate isomerase [bacterium]MBU1074110.1 phosphoribosylanthranilate isomerase [bacterium]MBU1676028.1 phosphoribosylanthranilate isomerase [bacterium]
MTRIKICCIGSVEEARLAVRLGASALGFVSEMPSGPGVIPEALIAEIVATVPPPIATFLLTSRTDTAEIVAQQKRCRVSTVQLCDRLPPEVHAELREAMPGISLVQVVHVAGDEAVSEAMRVARAVDALLLDSGNRSLPVKELGGTGRTHDWSLSARIVRDSPVPVFLAGGLGAENVGGAIRAVHPFGVDICTGVRTSGALDERKLLRFIEAVGESP